MINAIYHSYKPDLERVEARIISRLDSYSPKITEISKYLLSLGGKRIRPLMLLATAKMFGVNPITDEIINACAGVELIHAATLLHDDIIDQSPTRRHKPSAYITYGANQTLLVGDFLLTRAFGMCSKMDTFVITETERACIELTEGEIEEKTLLSDNPRTVEDYIEIAKRKTASLFSLGATLGGYIAKADTETVAKLREFGYLAGISFQMIDDILDVTSTEKELGKKTGIDLKQKTPSLVNVLWLQSGDQKAVEFFSDSFNPTEKDSEEAVKYLKNSEVIVRAKEIALSYANQAKEMVDDFDKGDIKTIVDYFVTRIF